MLVLAIMPGNVLPDILTTGGGMNDMAHVLEVKRSELEKAFRLVRRLCRPRPGEQAVLSYDGACLHVECGGVTVAPGARGCWPGQVRVDARQLVGWARLMPLGDPLVFRFHEGRLWLGNSSCRAELQQAWTKGIDMAMNATPLDFYVLSFTHSHEEIVASGYAGSVESAKEWVQRRVCHAAECLAELGITHSDVEEMVKAIILRKADTGGRSC